MRRGKLSFTTRYVLLVGILLFVANTALGVVILNQTKAAMQALVNKDMLDVVNSAAGSLDGDVLGSLTKEDVDGPAFKAIEDRLLVFQNSVEIQFIYAVKQEDEDHYVFTVDPDPVDPGEFGEEIVTTPALVQAAKGIATVDSAPAANRWGNFYSAYSPVFDSSGKVAGVVGVDFDADWYEAQILEYTRSIAIVTAISVTLGGVVVVLITSRVRTKFRELDQGLSDLSCDVDLLVNEMASYSGFEVEQRASSNDLSADESDELELLGSKIRTMQHEMHLYIEYLHSQAYTDSLTRVGNTTAYHDAVRDISAKIEEGTADFWIAVIDINDLKGLNDTYGHEMGDQYIQGTARVLKQAFPDASVYRIGGDEFAVIAEGMDDERMGECVRNTTAALDAFNEKKPCPMSLTVSKGVVRFDPEQDTFFKDVFSRADKLMYDDKRAYYETPGAHDRRARRT